MVAEPESSGHQALLSALPSILALLLLGSWIWGFWCILGPWLLAQVGSLPSPMCSLEPPLGHAFGPCAFQFLSCPGAEARWGGASWVLWTQSSKSCSSCVLGT